MVRDLHDARRGPSRVSGVKLRDHLDEADDMPVELCEVFGGYPQLLVYCAADGLYWIST
jgi:hypothetical protein